MSYLLYIILGLAPSFIWLSFYLRKDAHPEPKKTVLRIFFLGMGGGILAALIENLITIGLSEFNSSGALIPMTYILLGAPLIEEFLKYLAIENKFFVVRDGVLRESEFDEPLDLMLYMIIAALGFAATENVLKFFAENLPLFDTFLIASLRFIGATFLHALCSGAFGFFLALSWFNHEKRFHFLAIGLTIATFLHGIFNYSIIRIEQSLQVVNGALTIADFNLFLLASATLTITLIGLAVFVSLGFKKLKKMASICKINNR